ncbi:MAG: hypothetical protein ACTS4U_00770 [Candidatus Hodgkinia cicadicola]
MSQLAETAREMLSLALSSSAKVCESVPKVASLFAFYPLLLPLLPPSACLLHPSWSFAWPKREWKRGMDERKEERERGRERKGKREGKGKSSLRNCKRRTGRG